LVDRVDNMKKNVLGDGTNQCLLCGEEFGLLGASASECEECSKVASAVSAGKMYKCTEDKPKFPRQTSSQSYISQTLFSVCYICHHYGLCA